MTTTNENAVVLSPAEILALAMSEQNKILVNGKQISDAEVNSVIEMSIKGAIMRAQGVTESIFPEFGWVKHPKAVEVKYKGHKEKITVPQWNAGEDGQTHAEWKKDCIKSLRGQMTRLNFLRTNLAEVLAAPDAVAIASFGNPAKAETEVGNPVENANSSVEKPAPIAK